MSPDDTLPVLLHLTAFTTDPKGGNPAGVWLGPTLPDADEMQRIATEAGHSETAFLAPEGGGRFHVRYYSPEAEVPFCGHATVASGVVLGERFGEGTYRFDTAAGEVPVRAELREGRMVASLTSVSPRHRQVPAALLQEALAALGWQDVALDPALPPALAYAGAWHLVLAVAERTVLDALDYDFPRLKRAMLDADVTTLQLLWRENEGLFHARDPFPVGGVVEDPATGAAAAALGGYLRDAGLHAAPFSFTVLQGEAMGRPSRIEVSVPVAGGITVTGPAVPLERQ